MNTRPDRIRARRIIPTGPTQCETIKGYTDNALHGAISQLTRSPMATKKGAWECERLKALKAERDRRGKEGA
jgi:hypothetical protein